MAILTSSQESGDSLWPQEELDSLQKPSAKKTTTAEQSSQTIGQKSQSSTTSESLGAMPTEKSNCSQVGFLANHSPKPGSNEARRMTATSGQKCSELYKKPSPLGSLVRMCLVSSIWHSTKCILTWKQLATKSKRLLFRLQVSMPRTEETDAGSSHAFWATPNTMDHLPSRPAEDCSTNQKNRKNRTRSGNLREQVVHPKMWPTPTADNASNVNPKENRFRCLVKAVNESVMMWPTPSATPRGPHTGSIAGSVDKSGKSRVSAKGVKWGATLETAVKMWPTPSSRDGKGGYVGGRMRDGKISRDTLDVAVQATDNLDKQSGSLNPAFVEWLMGYPIGWTALKPSEMQSYRTLRRRSSKKSEQQISH